MLTSGLARHLSLILACALLTLALPLPPIAQDSITLDPSQGPPGTEVRVSGEVSHRSAQPGAQPEGGAIAVDSTKDQSTLTEAGAGAAQVWAGCGVFTDKFKVVRAFRRPRPARAGGKYMPRGISNLKCGSERWGYRHILDRHMSEWQRYASLERINWRDLADFAIEVALFDPDRITYDPSRDTFCFSRQIHLVDRRTGQVVYTKYPKVAVAYGSQNIITAFLGKSQC